MPPKIEFEKNVLEGRNHEHYLFMEKKSYNMWNDIYKHC